MIAELILRQHYDNVPISSRGMGVSVSFLHVDRASGVSTDSYI